ncbi:Carbohydrate binding domain protein [Maioricimonas rarisocia]|uniref:Carbohydrate binding domain protein n=1 Tax=Maioricimonas rarisocia TaxID=2528026 RepID=A0A517ZCH6_9PLAN|nr:carbohydrate binding domain-containing protein [Maioricimonas rarisocia]QDU40152.1 Carbohydrate binding domain protein [Maioricimonas rarisocia]
MTALRKPRRRSGSTLIELTISLIGSSVLMLGMASATFIALKASDTSLTPARATFSGASALTSMLAELQFAIDVSERTPTAITFTVPDRNGDGNPETIRYAWSGTPGDPLTRQYNGGASVSILENVHDFQHDLPVTSPNLLANADMEAGTTGWEGIPNSNMNADSSTVYAGSYSLYDYRQNNNFESGIRQDVTALVTSGQAYDMAGWMRKWAAAAPYNVRMQLRVTSTNEGEQLFFENEVNIDNASWTYVTATVTPTWTGNLTSAWWEVTGVSGIQDLYLDDAEFRVSAAVTDQTANLILQVGADAESAIRSGVRLLNSPL